MDSSNIYFKIENIRHEKTKKKFIKIWKDFLINGTLSSIYKNCFSGHKNDGDDWILKNMPFLFEEMENYKITIKDYRESVLKEYFLNNSSKSELKVKFFFDDSLFMVSWLDKYCKNLIIKDSDNITKDEYHELLEVCRYYVKRDTLNKKLIESLNETNELNEKVIQLKSKIEESSKDTGETFNKIEKLYKIEIEDLKKENENLKSSISKEGKLYIDNKIIENKDFTSRSYRLIKNLDSRFRDFSETHKSNYNKTSIFNYAIKFFLDNFESKK